MALHSKGPPSGAQGHPELPEVVCKMLQVGVALGGCASVPSDVLRRSMTHTRAYPRRSRETPGSPPPLFWPLPETSPSTHGRALSPSHSNLWRKPALYSSHWQPRPLSLWQWFVSGQNWGDNLPQGPKAGVGRCLYEVDWYHSESQISWRGRGQSFLCRKIKMTQGLCLHYGLDSKPGTYRKTAN